MEQSVIGKKLYDAIVGFDESSELQDEYYRIMDTLSGNKTTSDLGLFSGNYDDLSNKPVFTTWTYHGAILSETGIAASLTYNPVLKMAIIRISGSNDKPLNTTYTFNLPNFCTPVMELQCYARYMAWLTVSTNRTVTIRGVDTNSNWQSGSILFPYN